MVRCRSAVGALLWAVALATHAPAFAAEAPAAPEARAEGFVEVLRAAEAKTRGREWTEAAALWARVVALNPCEGDYWAQLAAARRSAGDDRGAIPALEKALELRAGFPWSSAYDIARCYARLGEKEPALQWLERALDMGYRNLRRAQTEADFEPLRSDPRYRRLVLLADVSKMSRNEGLRYDLGLLAREIKRLHYAPFRQVSQRDFDATVRKLHDAIPRLTDPQVAVGFMKLAQMAGDGHTHIDPVFMQAGKRAAAPVQFYLFTEGLFIIGTAPGHTDLLGAQLLRIGDHTVDEVMAALDPVISRDNLMWPKFVGPSLMRYPQILNGLGLIPDPARMPITIRGTDGKVRTVSLAADTGDPTDAWETARREASVADPLYLKNRRAAYWFEYLPAEKTVYFQYNSVQNLPREPMEKFCDRLFRFINENEVEKLVIDMRWNGGGNTFLNQPIVHGLIRCEKINQRGKLFVIVGRQTFSAAMNAATFLERHTNAIFAGEPTGSSPNFIGETIQISLPYTRMRGSISDLYWQSSWPLDYRTWIAPLLYAPPSFALYRANRDPALEAILAYRDASRSPTAAAGQAAQR